MAKTQLYEVSFRKLNDAWIVADSFKDHDKAVARIETLGDDEEVSAMRLVQIATDPKTKQVSRRTLFEKECADIADANGPDRIIPCSHPKDLYKKPAREMMGRALSTFLRSRNLTPKELLFRPDEVRRVTSSGPTLQHAAQIAAVELKEGTKNSPHAIMKAIFDLVDGAVGQLHRDVRDKVFPKIKEGRLASIQDAVEASEDPEYVLSGAIAQDIAAQASAADKLDCLLNFDDEMPKDQAYKDLCITVIDDFASEILTRSANLNALLGEQPDMGSALRILMDTTKGAFTTDKTSQTHHLNRLSIKIKNGHTPQVKAVLIQRILHLFGVGRSLAKESVRDDIEVSAEIAKFLDNVEEGIVSTAARRSALESRSRYLVSDDLIAAYFKECGDVKDRVKGLLYLAEMIDTKIVRSNVTSYLRSIFISNKFEAVYFDEDVPVVSRLTALKKMQDIIREAGFEEDDTNTLVETIGRLAGDVDTRAQFFQSIERGQTCAAQKALGLLKLMVADTFAEGPCLNRAADMIARQVRHPKFLEDFVYSIMNDENQARDIPGRLDEFQELLVAADMKASEEDDEDLEAEEAELQQAS